VSSLNPDSSDTTAPHLVDYVDSTDGVSVPLYDFGGDGPPVLFCHATGFCAHVWLPVVAQLQNHFRCYALDFRGHGRSRVPADISMAWSGMADDVLAVVDALVGGESDRAAGSVELPLRAVGHSMGGSSIITAQTRRPGTFGSTWMFEPILLPSGPVLLGDDAPAIAQGARKRKPVFASREEVRQRYGARPPLNSLDPRALDAYITHGFVDTTEGTVRLRCTPEVEAQVFCHHLSGTFERSLEVPLDIVVGIGNENGDVEAMITGQIRQAAAENQRMVLHSYPDLTHFGPLEAPEIAAAAIVAAIG